MRAKRHHRSWAVAILTATLVAGCAAQPVELDWLARSRTTVDPAVPRGFASDAVLAALVDPDGPGCSAAVAVLGDVAWTGAVGLADVAAGIPLTPDTRMEIASVSKQFTATAILMLQREGRLSLTDPVARYVDRLPAWGRTVTLEQLMHHTSRVRDYWVRLDADGLGFEDHADHATIMDAIRRLPSLEPGTGYSYSNSNYVLLAEVVHRVSGMPLPEFLRTRIFEPLGLGLELSPNLKGPGIARSYDDDGRLQPPGWAAYGAVGILAAPGELARWGDQYRRLDGPVQAEFADGAVDEGTGEWYAAGIDLEADGSLNHTGRYGGYVSTFTVSADRRTTVVVLCNGHLAPRFPIEDALWELWGPRS